MTFRYRYYREIGCLYTCGKGKVSLQDFIDYHLSIKIENPRPTLLILADYRELDASDLSAADVEKIKASALRKVETKYEKVKEATVVSDFLMWGLTRQYDGVFYSETYDLHVFTDIYEARNWLGLDPETVLKIEE
jgi:hypothetical protein